MQGLLTASDGPNWDRAWRVLGSERSKSLFPLLGIPPGMAARPQRLQELAQAAWDVVYCGLPGVPESWVPGFDAAYANAYHALITSFFNHLANHYGAEEATALFAWARRHFVDYERSAFWFNWSRIFISMARTSRRRHGPLALPLPTLAWLRSSVTKALGAEALNALRGHTQAVMTQSKSSFEERALRWYDEEGGEIDLVPTLVMVMIEERTREMWREIERRLSPDEVETFMRWAQRQAVQLNIPTERLQRPNET